MRKQHLVKSISRNVFVALVVCLLSVGLWTRDSSAEMRGGPLPQMSAGMPPMPMLPPAPGGCMIPGMEHRGMMGCMGGMEGEGMGHGMMMDDEHFLWRRIMALGLEEKQRGEVEKIRDSVMKEMIKKRADAQVAEIDLKELLDQDAVDMKRVEAKLKQIETVKTEMRLSLIKAREEVKSILTPEQRKKFKEPPEMGPMMGDRDVMGRMSHEGMRPTPPGE